MVISNWVERKLEDRRLRQQKEFADRLREEGRKEGFEQGRAYERERIQAETNGKASDDPPRENNR